MTRDKIGFLILHYYAYEETINFIQSIKKNIDTNNYEIVVVDNCSPNGSGTYLKQKYKNDSKVTVILNKENLGFARGNNVGFKHLKYELKCNYIVMLNNDVLILSDNIFKQIKTEFKTSNFAVMGPKIYDINYNVVHFRKYLPTINELKRSIFILRSLLILNYLHISNLVSKIYNFFKGNKKEEIPLTEKKEENIILHGCCLIFSPLYVKKFDGIDDRTFLYREEDFLYLRLLKNNMKSLYNPDIEIQHLEDVATNKSLTNLSKRRKNFYTNELKSCKLLLEDLKQK